MEGRWHSSDAYHCQLPHEEASQAQQHALGLQPNEAANGQQLCLCTYCQQLSDQHFTMVGGLGYLEFSIALG